MRAGSQASIATTSIETAVWKTNGGASSPSMVATISVNTAVVDNIGNGDSILGRGLLAVGTSPEGTSASNFPWISHGLKGSVFKIPVARQRRARLTIAARDGDTTVTIIDGSAQAITVKNLVDGDTWTETFSAGINDEIDVQASSAPLLIMVEDVTLAGSGSRARPAVPSATGALLLGVMGSSTIVTSTSSSSAAINGGGSFSTPHTEPKAFVSSLFSCNNAARITGSNIAATGIHGDGALPFLPADMLSTDYVLPIDASEIIVLGPRQSDIQMFSANSQIPFESLSLTLKSGSAAAGDTVCKFDTAQMIM